MLGHAYSCSAVPRDNENIAIEESTLQKMERIGEASETDLTKENDANSKSASDANTTWKIYMMKMTGSDPKNKDVTTVR